MQSLFKVIAILMGSVFLLCFMAVCAIGILAPETSVYLGHQIPKRYVQTIDSLQLTEPGETIKYFYSDGLFDIKDGMYFVTNKSLVAYSDSWNEPRTIVPFHTIVAAEFEPDPSFWNDSFIHIETDDGLELSFPVSSEKKRDQKFFQHILDKAQLSTSGPDTDVLQRM